jgi:L-rhamnonate dehydratase
MQEVVRPTLVAGGEHEFTHYGFAEIVRAKALDLWQPDITWCGGLTAGLRIVDLANTEGIPVSPHRGGPEPRNGYIAPSDRPGFGVRLNESLL